MSCDEPGGCCVGEASIFGLEFIEAETEGTGVADRLRLICLFSLAYDHRGGKSCEKGNTENGGAEIAGDEAGEREAVSGLPAHGTLDICACHVAADDSRDTRDEASERGNAKHHAGDGETRGFRRPTGGEDGSAAEDVREFGKRSPTRRALMPNEIRGLVKAACYARLNFLRAEGAGLLPLVLDENSHAGIRCEGRQEGKEKSSGSGRGGVAVEKNTASSLRAPSRFFRSSNRVHIIPKHDAISKGLRKNAQRPMPSNHHP